MESTARNYKEVKESAFATCRIPDGYFGDTAEVLVSVVGNVVMFVADHGYFRAPLPLVQNKEEAVWLLTHHPDAKNVTEIKTIK